jgi:undecaprenyl-diphosphatase
VSGTLSYFDAVVLGFVEGVTEFLPVSSTGHLTITEKLLGLPVDAEAVTAFTAIIQFGAIVATFLYFRADIARLGLAWVSGLLSATERQHPDYRFAWYVIAGSTPVVVAAIMARSLITGPLRSLWVVAAALVLWSAVMWFAERRPSQRLEEKDLGLREVLVIGLVQCFSLIPGVSRSGATISAGLLAGVDRVTATRLSFFLAIPALTGAGIFQLPSVDPDVVGWGPLAVGTLVSFVVAYASIAWLLRFVARHPISLFVPYRVVLGIALAVLLGTGVLSAT